MGCSKCTCARVKDYADGIIRVYMYICMCLSCIAHTLALARAIYIHVQCKSIGARRERAKRAYNDLYELMKARLGMYMQSLFPHNNVIMHAQLIITGHTNT